MTLKEKICEPFGGLLTETASELEKIAEDFAVEFAEWCDDYYFRMGNTSFWAETFDFDNEIKYSTKELLEIFKRKRGL
jgi:hypothetical protein